jgi:hypothetical protein
MAEAAHSLAPHHLPVFLPGADGSDILYTFTVVMIIAMVLGFGVIYFTLHALPEKIAHGTSSTQFQLIGVLALLAMFTHNNIFWVAALLLATMKLPDFTTPLNSIARSLEALKDREPDTILMTQAAVQSPPTPRPPPAPMQPSTVMPGIQPQSEEAEASEVTPQTGGDNLKPGPG